MKQPITALAVCAFLCATVSYGATITCASNISLSVGGTSPTITCGSLTLSNFSVFNSTGNSAGRLDISSVSEDSSGTVSLSEVPNLGANGHLDLSFVVVGGVDALDLSVGGSRAAVNEKACANSIPTSGMLAGLCADTGGKSSVTPLGVVTAHSNTVNQPVFSDKFPVTSPIYVFKDIVTTGKNSELTVLNESFHTPVPEPASFALFGAGLATLGLIRRRRKA